MPIALVSSVDEKAWHRERARRVTKSRATRLVNPSIRTFKSIHGESSFKGNESTRRGHRLEPVAASWVEAQLGIPESQILYAHETNPMHAATPDCALEDEGEWSLVEIKTTTEDWSGGLPRKIIRDVLWQRYVMGAGYSAVCWWQVDDKGQPVTMEPSLVEVDEDPHELQRMIDGADAYLAWVDAGCPEVDEAGVPLEVIEDIEAVNAGKAAEARLRARMEQGGEAVNLTTSAGSLKFSVSESTSFDKDAYLLSVDADVLDKITEAEALLKAAQKDPEYRKPTVRTSFTVAPPKEPEEVAA